MSKPVGPYSPILISGEWCIVSGQIGLREGELRPGSGDRGRFHFVRGVGRCALVWPGTGYGGDEYFDIHLRKSLQDSNH